MKRFLVTFAVTLLFLCSHAHASTCATEASGRTYSQINADLIACGSGNTLPFASGGTWTLTGQIKIPCGVTMSGPVIPYPGYPIPSGGLPYSATLLYPSLGTTPAISFTTGCSGTGSNSTGTVQYFNMDAEQPAPDGGGAIYLPSGGGTGVNILNNYIHGNWANTSTGSQGDTLIWIDGSPQTSPTVASWNNVTIQWNHLGGYKSGTPDCNNLNSLFLYQGGNYNSAGGECAGIGIHSNFSNLQVLNNVIGPNEQGMKMYEAGHQGSTSAQFYQSGTNNVSYNDFYGQHRCGMLEDQQTPNNTLEISYNDIHDQNNPGQGNWLLSIPAWDPTTGTNTMFTNADYNLFIANVNANTSGQTDAGGYAPGAIELWGAGHTNGNVFQSNSNGFAYAVQWGDGISPWAIENNIVQNPTGNYFNSEEGKTNTPTESGNTTSTTVTTQTSLTPNISPASGSFSGSQTITLSLPSTSGINTNTSIWYTTDGCTPVVGALDSCGANKTILYSAPFTISASTTVKYRGMWGAANQPYSYPSGYGYVPSAVQTATYTLTGGGTKTLSSVALSLTANDTSIHPGETNQASVLCTYSDGSTDACSSYTVTWASSSTGVATISSSGLVTGVGNGSTNLTATANGITSPTIALTVQTLTSITISSAGGNSIHVGSTSQLTATCNYSNGYSDNCNTVDLYDYTASWASGTPADGTVSSSGLFTGVAVGSTVITASAGGINGTLTITVATATVSSIALTMSGNITTLQAGGMDGILANCTYSDSTTAQCYPTSYASSNTSAATVNSSGLVTGVAAGTTNLTAILSGVTSSSLALTVAAGTPTWSSGYLANDGSVNTISVGTQLQFSAVCIYTNGNTDNCSSIGGVTGWTTSNSAILTVSALGLAQCVATGTATLHAQVGSHTTNGWDMTCTAAPALSSVSLALYGGVTSIPVGANVQEILTCTYADGSSDNCTGPADTRGNVGSGFTSSSTATATVSSSGLVTPVANGTTTLSATAGGKTATLNITVTGGAAPPTLVSAYQTNAGPVSTMTLYTNPLIQQHAMCVYSDSTVLDCTFGDTRGSTVTAWSSQYSGAIVSIGAVGSTTPGIVSPVNAGRANTLCTVTGGLSCTPYPWTVIYPPRASLTAPGMRFSGVRTH